MDFKSIFDTYSNNVDTTERSNIFTQSAPPANSEAIKNFVESYDSNNEQESTEQTSNTEGTPTETPVEISDDVLSALSELDEKPSEEEVEEIVEETPTDNPFENINAEIEDSIEESSDIISDNNQSLDQFEEDTVENLEDDIENLEIPIDDLSEDLSDDLIGDEAQNIEIPTEDFNETEETMEEIEDTLDTEDSEDDTFDVEEALGSDETPQEEDFVDNISMEDSDLSDIEDPFDAIDTEVEDMVETSEELIDETSEEPTFEGTDIDEDSTSVDEVDNFIDSMSEDASDLGFDIELPEVFTEEIEALDKAEEESAELPDFNDTEMSPSDSKTPIMDGDLPTDYESIDKSINFDAWGKQSKKDYSISLTEEQSFKIRYKINSISDQNIRFRIREIIADPESHGDIYQTLMPLLLVDTPESSFVSFFEKLDDEQGLDAYQITDIPEYTSTFLAQDVVDYQDTIYRIKTEFVYNIKKYALYGVIALLTGTIAWFGVAQPMRVNSIFEKGLAEVRLDNYLEGEALFQQANTIAGEPVAEWYMKYADVYKDKGLVSEAGSKYLSALVIEPKNITIATHASDFYTNLGPKYYSNAMTIMNNLTSYYPKDFSVWDYLGMLYVNYSDFFVDDRAKQTSVLYDAIDVYQKYLLNNFKDPAPFYRMLDIYIRIGNKTQIDKITKLLSDLDPKYINLEMMNHLGKYYTDNRNLTESDYVFRKITPVLDKYHRDIKPLQEYMHKLYNVEPDQISNILSDSYYEFARYKMLSSDFKLAGTLLTNSLMFNGTNVDSYNLLGEAYLRSSEPTATKIPKAKELFEQALSYNPNNYKSHINLGHLYYVWDKEFGDVNIAHNNALYHYKYATSLMPENIKNTLLSYNHGWLEYHNNNPANAIDIWSEIYKNNPNNAIVSYALGSALYQSDKPELAQVVLEKAANNLESLRQGIPYPDLSNRRHREIFTQLAKTYNNIGVVNANYGLANSGRREDFEAKALMNFYKAQDLSDQLRHIYSTTEYNIGVLTRPNISNRKTVFDDDIPKQTSLENPVSQFNNLLLENI